MGVLDRGDAVLLDVVSANVVLENKADDPQPAAPQVALDVLDTEEPNRLCPPLVAPPNPKSGFADDDATVVPVIDASPNTPGAFVDMGGADEVPAAAAGLVAPNTPGAFIDMGGADDFKVFILEEF